MQTGQPILDESTSHLSSHGIIRKFAYLLGAYWIREGLRATFLITLARHSSTTYGEFMLATSIGQILLFVAEFGLNQHLVTLLAQKDAKTGDLLLQASILKSGLLLCGSVGTFFFVQWQGYPLSLRALVFILGMGIGLEAIASSFFVACQVQGRQDAEGKVKTVAATFGFGYGLIMLFAGAVPLLLALFKGIETLVNLFGSILVSRKRKKTTFQWPQLWSLWTTARGSMVFTVMALATTLYNHANIFFLQKAAGAEGVAQYGVTWDMVDGISCLTSNLLLRNVLFPLFVNLWGNNRAELNRVVRESSRWLIAVSIPITFFLGAESDRLITLLYGSHYSDAVWMQKYLVVTIFISFLHNLAAYLMISMKEERLLLAFYLGGLVLNLLLCAIIIPTYPLMGAVSAIILTKGIVGAATVSFCQLRFGLISMDTLLRIGGASFLGCLLYVAGNAFLFREMGEVLALVPIFILILSWRRSF
ncbi:MAG: oligosaccharide flippase family protein [Deltaproteobacteria bacterium]|nr:oligosaccharide flippase family protein [Deltaproteobacteria bacterium]